jgi:hypothetical protein
MVSLNFGGSFGSFGHTGSSPEPFDAVDGHRLAGGASSHPLHAISIDDLLRPSSGMAQAVFAFDHPAMVGEGITGTLRITGLQPIGARGATLRLVGLRLVEQKKSTEHTDSDGHVTSSENWVEANGSLFVHDEFPEPAIPNNLQPGEVFEARFAVPAPRLGPPTAHLGEAIVAWALEVRWDIPHAGDAFVAVGIPVAQHPDLLRAGVGKQGGISLMEVVSVGGATIAVPSPLPAPVGSEIVVRPAWPGAPGGRMARIELHRRTNAPNGTEGIVASAIVDSDAVRAGSGEARLLVPPGSAPSFDGAGLEINYVIRVLVDRRFMPDAAIERPVGIA